MYTYIEEVKTWIDGGCNKEKMRHEKYKKLQVLQVNSRKKENKGGVETNGIITQTNWTIWKTEQNKEHLYINVFVTFLVLW